MIASWIEENEITQVQSQKDISEVQRPLCRQDRAAGEGQLGVASETYLRGVVAARKIKDRLAQEIGYFRDAISGKTAPFLWVLGKWAPPPVDNAAKTN